MTYYGVVFQCSQYVFQKKTFTQVFVKRFSINVSLTFSYDQMKY